MASTRWDGGPAGAAERREARGAAGSAVFGALLPACLALMASSRSDLRMRAVPLIPSWAATAWSSGSRSAERAARGLDSAAISVVSVT